MSPYDVLEVSSRATEEEVRSAYKMMAKKWHPDRMLDDQETATRKFKDINSAYRAILRERRREARKRSSSPSTSSIPSQQKPNSVSSSSADRPDDSRYSSRSKSSQKDHERSARSRERAKDRDTSHDSHRYKPEGGSLNEKKSSSDGSKKSSDQTNKPTARSHPARSSRSHSSRESSPSSPPSSRSSSTSRSSKSSPSSGSSYNSGSSTEDLSSASTSRTSVKSSPSSDSLPEQEHGPGTRRDHYAHQSSPNSSTPSFTSYTSSEVSAYDNPEIAPPGASRNEPCGQETKSVTKDTGTSPRPARPPDEKLQSGRRERDHHNHHHHHHKMRKGGEEGHEERTLIPEYDSPLARAVGMSKEWTYTIRLTLEELFYGKKLRFKVLRCKLDGKRKTVILDVDVPAGSVHGTQIIFRGAGHERKDGTRQDIVFIIEEAEHERFVRIKEDLMLDVRLPWVEALKKEAAVVYAKGLDGKESMFEVNFAREGNVTGTTVIPGAGMPIPGTDKRGKLVVRWEIYMPSTTSRWGAIKQALSL